MIPCFSVSMGLQIDEQEFLDQMGEWMATIQAVSIPRCVAEADMLNESGKMTPTSPRLRSLYATSPEHAGTAVSPIRRALSPVSTASHTRSSTVAGSLRRSSARVGDTDSLSAQAAAFRAWLTTVDSTSVTCFEVFRQCYNLAPRLLSHTFASVSGSQSEVPTEAIANVFERLVAHPPHFNQTAQLMMFLDVQVCKAVPCTSFHICSAGFAMQACRHSITAVHIRSIHAAGGHANHNGRDEVPAARHLLHCSEDRPRLWQFFVLR